jgi:hypothetical protein
MDVKTLINSYLNSAVTILSECDITFKDLNLNIAE